MNQVTNPHDKFVKELFSDKEKAKDFLINFVPKEILKFVDLSNLEIVKDSF